MNLFAEMKDHVLSALADLAAQGALPDGLNTGNVTAEPPRDAAHGDIATNAAMVLSKQAGMKPRDLAEALAEKLRANDAVQEVTVAGPGFLNLRVSDAVWHQVAAAALSAGDNFGRSSMGQGQKVNVEFVSANPTGPLHVGHTRGAVFGDALAALLDFAGWDVTREYYINDGGAQVDVVARSAHLRYREALGEEIEIGEGLYPGDYLKPVGEALKAKFGETLRDAPEAEWLPVVREFATEAMMDQIRADLAAVGIKMDVFFSEKSLFNNGPIEATIETLKSRDLIYQGVLEPPKGKKPEDWEPRPQTLFRSTAYGDDVDRPIQKADGS